MKKTMTMMMTTRRLRHLGAFSMRWIWLVGLGIVGSASPVATVAIIPLRWDNQRPTVYGLWGSGSHFDERALCCGWALRESKSMVQTIKLNSCGRVLDDHSSSISSQGGVFVRRHHKLPCIPQTHRSPTKDHLHWLSIC